jgi:repressor LexA
MLSLVLRETLIFIHRFQVEHGTSPTIRELEAGLGIGHGSAQSRQNRLIEKGFLQSLPGKARTLRLRSQAIDYLMAIGEYKTIQMNSNIIPLFGEIAAGYLSDPATESETFEIEHLDSANHFALRVSGDSMVNAGILNGVVAIFKQVPDGYEPKPGAIVAAYVEGAGTTLKQFYRQDWQVILKAANPLYPDQSFDTRQTLVQVNGIWTGMTIAPNPSPMHL